MYDPITLIKIRLCEPALTGASWGAQRRSFSEVNGKGGYRLLFSLSNWSL